MDLQAAYPAKVQLLRCEPDHSPGGTLCTNHPGVLPAQWWQEDISGCQCPAFFNRVLPASPGDHPEHLPGPPHARGIPPLYTLPRYHFSCDHRHHHECPLPVTSPLYNAELDSEDISLHPAKVATDEATQDREQSWYRVREYRAGFLPLYLLKGHSLQARTYTPTTSNTASGPLPVRQ